MRHLLILFLLVAAPANANPLKRIGHFVKTHKVELAADVLMMATSHVDAQETLARERRNPFYGEANPFMHGHPSQADLWHARLIEWPVVITLTRIGSHYTHKWGNLGFEQQSYLLLPLLVSAGHVVGAAQNANVKAAK